jgi:hypothetical protein
MDFFERGFNLQFPILLLQLDGAAFNGIAELQIFRLDPFCIDLFSFSRFGIRK